MGDKEEKTFNLLEDVCNCVCDCSKDQSKISTEVCAGPEPDDESEKSEIPWRKQQILTTVARTEDYLRQRRIPELIKFLLTKMLAELSNKPVIYLENLLDECMMFRAGLGMPPVLYERRHLEAVVKSFDPGNRGWLNAGQVRRAYTTLGLRPPQEPLEDKVPTETVLNELEQVQKQELYELLTAGSVLCECDVCDRLVDSN